MASFASSSGNAADQEEEDNSFMMSKEEILDELAMQKTMLESLDPSSSDYLELKVVIERSISKMRALLASKKQNKKQPAFPLKGPFLAASLASARNASARSPNNNNSPQTARRPGTIAAPSYHPSSSTQHPPSNYNSSDPFADFAANQSTSANMDPFADPDAGQPQTNLLSPTGQAGLPHRNLKANKKRSIDESVGFGFKEESDNKSRRTSPGSSIPTPTAHYTDANGFVDLCDSDEEDARQKQIKAIERANQTQKDREQALQMQHRYDNIFIETELPDPPNLLAPPRDRTSPYSQTPSARGGGSTQGPNVPHAMNSTYPPSGAFPIDLTNDDVQFMSSKPKPYFVRPDPARQRNSWLTNGIFENATSFTPYTQSPYTNPAGMQAPSPMGTYSMGNMAQGDVSGMGSSLDSSLDPALFQDMGMPGSSWNGPGGMDVRSNLSMNQQHDLETYITDPRRTKEDIQNLLANLTPDIEIPKESREGTPEGLRYPLYEHQRVALTWLLKNETGSNKGGILADDMGLGKTISTIALMLSRPSTNPFCKTTLIIGPVALLKQWEKEIRDKIDPSHRLSVFVYHSVKTQSFDDLRTYDVVLTSYGTLAVEYKKLHNLLERKRAHPEMDLKRDEYQKTLPFLGDKSQWYRVVLDEAQCIKNKETKSAKAVTALKAHTRFCLTGTPMMNGIHELFSLIRFLRIRPYCDGTKFNDDFKVLKKGVGSKYQLDRAMKRLQALLRSIILRRTKTSTIDGNPLITLPPKTEEVIHAIFDEDQQKYYTALEGRSKVELNKYVRNGTVGKNYSNVLVLLLRLRQAACHPHLIMDLEQAAVSGGGDMVARALTLPPDVVTRLKDSEVPFECPVCYEISLAPIFTLNCCHHVCSECLAKITTNLNAADVDENGRMVAKPRCPTCRGEIDANKCIDWGSFKAAHMPDPSDAVDAEDDVSSDYSDSDSDLDSVSDVDERDKDDVDSQGNLRGFIVDDDAVDDGFMSRKLASKKKEEAKPLRASPRQIVEDSEDETDDLDAKPVKPETKSEDTEDDEPETKAEAADDDFLPEYPGTLFSKVEVPADDYFPENPSEARARGMMPEKLERITKKATKEADDHAARKLARKERRKAKAKASGKTKKKGDKAPHKHLNLATLKKEASKNAEGKRKYIRYLRKNWVSSAKIDKLMELIQNTPEDVKTIVFSQFTTLLDLCEIPLAKADIKVQRYDGSMKADMRHTAVQKFQHDPTTKVLLVSLKAGNAGLNLVAGSQVVIMDPFWNPYVEMQAVDRAYRIGQQKPVTVHRIIVKGTVEDRIIALQERKRKQIDSALDEKSGNAVSKLGIDELIDLFNGDGGARETLIRPPPPPVPNYGAGGGLYGSSGLGSAVNSGLNAGYNAYGSGLGSAVNSGLNAGLNAYGSGASFGSSVGAAAGAYGRSVVSPYLAGMKAMEAANANANGYGGGSNGGANGNGSTGGSASGTANGKPFGEGYGGGAANAVASGVADAQGSTAGTDAYGNAFDEGAETDEYLSEMESDASGPPFDPRDLRWADGSRLGGR